MILEEKKKKQATKGYILRVLLCVGTSIMVIVIALLGCILIVEFGPSKTARNLFVNSAMESSAGKFMATMFFSESEIEEIRSANSVVSSDEITDTSLINIESANGDALAVSGEVSSDDIEVQDIQGDTYKGKMMIIKNPARVTVGVSGDYGPNYSGKTVSDMAQSYNAIAAVNGGGFEDAGGTGNGGTPIGLVISDDKLKYGSLSTTYEVIGFDHNNALIVGKMTAQHALDIGVRDAISFGPILIVNGEASIVNGSGSGLNPRTAIGQRKDGAILLMTMDGRQVNSVGGSYADIIEVMMDYGAVNAANLDGGSSTLMYYNGEYINNCSSLYGPRNMPTCIVVR
jgi:exopolysaccharide biosynthesis protein